MHNKYKEPKRTQKIANGCRRGFSILSLLVLECSFHVDYMLDLAIVSMRHVNICGGNKYFVTE